MTADKRRIAIKNVEKQSRIDDINYLSDKNVEPMISKKVWVPNSGNNSISSTAAN
jgi:hypothetical protein